MSAKSYSRLFAPVSISPGSISDGNQDEEERENREIVFLATSLDRVFYIVSVLNKIRSFIQIFHIWSLK